MGKAYRIDNRVIYNPELHSLRLCYPSAPQDVIQLNVPASRCLELLLKNRYNIMNQKAFFKFVWEDNGVYVSANTLYQNISLLRKAFKNLGLDDVVKTISKQGLVITETISVEEIEEDDIDIPLEPLPLTTQPRRYGSHPVAVSRLLLGSKVLLTALVALIIGFIIISITDRYQHKAHQGYFDHYVKFAEINNCMLFRANTDKTDDKYLSFIKQNPIECEEKSWIYLTIPKGRPQISLIMCNKSILESGVKCRSYDRLRELNYD
jgi:DNA-binding winged helix-turn-helix (wHTH) protein